MVASPTRLHREVRQVLVTVVSLSLVRFCAADTVENLFVCGMIHVNKMAPSVSLVFQLPDDEKQKEQLSRRQCVYMNSCSYLYLSLAV